MKQISFDFRACFQTHHISLLPKFWLVFLQNFFQYARYSGKILPKSRTKFGQNRNALGLKTGSNALEDYVYWQQHDRTMIKRINALIKEIARTPFSGTGKPEALRGNLSGFWSRRINDEHRLVYMIQDGRVIIVQCRYHYQP